MKNTLSGKCSGLYKFTASAIVTAIFTMTPAVAHLKHQGNLVVDDAYVEANGSLIEGDYTGTISTPAILVTTTLPVLILNASVEGTGDLIVGQGGNDITVVNTTGIADNPNVRGVQKGIFLRVTKPVNVAMRYNVIQGVRIGLYLNGYSGDHTHNQSVRLIGNDFLNIDGRPSNGKGGYAETGQYNGQAIHMNNAYGIPAMEFAWNQVINQPGQSATGAIFEFSESGGTASSPTLVHDNYIQGAFPANPGVDLYEFGGICVNGATSDTVTTTSAFINVYDNQVVATANYGIAIMSGHDITFTNNQVVSSGYTATGAFYPMSTYGEAYGAYNANQLNLPATVFFNNHITGNTLGLIKNNGAGAPVRSDWSLPGQNNNVEGNLALQPNVSTSPVPADEDNALVTFQAKFKEYGVAVGLKQ